MADLEGIAVSLIDGRRDEVVAKVKQAIEEAVPPEKILNDALVAGMSVVGERFRRN
ncbi:MAG: B12-binding domain-containing protein, partial [Phycisphaerae bacterium]